MNRRHAPRPQFRVTGTWDARPDRPAVKQTPDKAHARRVARDMAKAGAYVVVEKWAQHHGRRLYEIDGRAQRVADDRDRRIEQALAERAAQMRAERAAQAARTRAAIDARTLMAAPAHARRDPGRARHTTGGRR